MESEIDAGVWQEKRPFETRQTNFRHLTSKCASSITHFLWVTMEMGSQIICQVLWFST